MSQPGSTPQAVRKGKRPSNVVLSSSDDELSEDDRRRKKNKVEKGVGDSQAEQPEDDDDSDPNGLDTDGEDVRGPTGREKGKRRATDATNGNDMEAVNGDGTQGADDHEVKEEMPQYQREYDRDEDGYVAGSVVRIKMRNFMTYHFVEFEPGPHLNMVLGPNGTGKSTIAAAIAIGLGFPQKVMGRSSDLKSYIKQGTERAETEIVLKGSKGKRNAVITRSFGRGADKDEFTMNGKSTTKSAVLKVVQELGIQANNLCTFLPQDRVADFAKLEPVLVLKETLRAAGDPRLSSWHEQLVEKGKANKQRQDLLDNAISRRTNLQDAVTRMEPDVQNYRDRAEQETEQRVLEAVLRIAVHQKLCGQRTDLLQQRAALKNKRRVLTGRNKPLLELAEHHEERKQTASLRTEEAEHALEQLPKDWKNALRRYDDTNREVEEVDGELHTLKQRIKSTEAKKERYRKAIREAQAILELPQEDLNTEIRAKGRQQVAVHNKINSIKDEKAKIQEELDLNEKRLSGLTKALEHKSESLRRISNLKTKREDQARILDPSIGYLIDWLAKNEMRMEGKVHRPPMISVNIKDPKYAWQVEACTSLGQRKTFICESSKDYDIILEEVNKQRYPAFKAPNGRDMPSGEVRLYLSSIKVTDSAVNPVKPCSYDQLKRLDLDGFAIDFVEAEPAVIAFLNEKCGMYRAALTQNENTAINPDAVCETGISTWITNNDVNRAKRSRYGSRAFQISTSGPTAARAFAESIDQNQVKKIEEEVAAIKRQQRDFETPHNKLKENSRKLSDQIIIEERAKAEIDGEMAALRERASRFTAAKHQLDSAKRHLADAEKEISGDQRRQELRAQKFLQVSKLVKPVQDHVYTTSKALELCSMLVFNSLRELQGQVNSDAISVHKQATDEEAIEIDEKIREVRRQLDTTEVQINNALAEFEALMGVMSPALKIRVKAQSKTQPTPEEVLDRLAAVRNELELSARVDGSVIQRYDRIKKDLDECTGEVRREEKAVSKLRREINGILASFDPALNALVAVVSAKFSAAFQRIGCSGEVVLHRVENNYAAWGIGIWVSYRDNEPLSLLNSSRQSGGERSLATVTYLMSLSEMARTPFSLVDEINQGMDQNAERNVHNQLVEVTCGTDAGQYFLITPKLLTGLRYHEKMKILIVNNGTWIPDSSDKAGKYGDLKSCLARYAAAHSARE